MYIYYNPNPTGRNVGDCAIRAISKALNVDWEEAFMLVAKNAYLMGDMPSSNSVWGAVLRQILLQIDPWRDPWAKNETPKTLVNQGELGIFMVREASTILWWAKSGKIRKIPLYFKGNWGVKVGKIGQSQAKK